MNKPPEAKKGALVTDWARDLVEWAMSFRLFAGAGVRLTVTPQGTWVNAVSEHVWDHPFRVSVSGKEARVSVGMVDGEIPFIKQERLDGTGPEYEITDETPPTIDLEPLGMEDGRSRIVLRMIVKDDGSVDTTEWESFSIAHLEMEWKFEKLYAMQPLAILNWRGGQVVRVDQVVHHHLHYYFLAGDTEEDEPEHLFSAV